MDWGSSFFSWRYPEKDVHLLPSPTSFKMEESYIVKAFLESNTHMWFRDPLPENSVIHHLPVVDDKGRWIGP